MTVERLSIRKVAISTGRRRRAGPQRRHPGRHARRHQPRLGGGRHPRRLQRPADARRVSRRRPRAPDATLSVRGITHLGGTILGTTNRGSPLAFPVAKSGRDRRRGRPDGGTCARCLRSTTSTRTSPSAATARWRSPPRSPGTGVRIVGVPKTIDNDLDKTVVTFGFDTAVSFATEALDRLHSTAESHGRIMVVEVMGRYAGWIALHCGVAGSADAILIPEIPYDLANVAEKVRRARGPGPQVHDGGGRRRRKAGRRRSVDRGQGGRAAGAAGRRRREGGGGAAGADRPGGARRRARAPAARRHPHFCRPADRAPLRRGRGPRARSRAWPASWSRSIRRTCSTCRWRRPPGA